MEVHELIHNHNQLIQFDSIHTSHTSYTIRLSEMSDADKTLPWTSCKWVKKDVQQLRDLWTTSTFADEEDITFDCFTRPLTKILVSADAEFMDDDVERGRVECNKIKLRLLDYQKSSVNDSRRSANDIFSSADLR